jgi:TorA maturation chaperone TorD
MESDPLVFTPVIVPEDQARADFYALLSRLYTSAPDAPLLASIAAAGELVVAAGDGPAANLARAWRALIAESAATDPAAVESEYQQLFVGVGQSEVSLLGSAYAKAARGGPLLVQVRDSLTQLKLVRQSGATMFEDHLAAVFETMRVLITGLGQPNAFAFDVQREFYQRNIDPWVNVCCNAISAKSLANYYSRVAQFTDCFMAVERDSFAMDH